MLTLIQTAARAVQIGAKWDAVRLSVAL